MRTKEYVTTNTSNKYVPTTYIKTQKLDKNNI